MNLIARLDKVLAGWPDAGLTWLLIGLSVFGVAVALAGKPSLKAAVAAYWLFP